MAATGTSFRVGAWTADPAGLVLSSGEVTVHLRPKVMELLAAFAEHPGEVLSKKKLLELLWSDVTVGDASLTVAVCELREVLGDRPDAPEYIETIPRRGYRLIAEVSGVDRDRPPAAGRPSRFWLVGHDVEVVLVEGENVIGRAPDADVRIPSARVSRHHARIVVSGDTATLEDLGSKNGTFVGGARLDQPTSLNHGDELRLGQMTATLRVVVVGQGSTASERSRETAPDARAPAPTSSKVRG